MRFSYLFFLVLLCANASFSQGLSYGITVCNEVTYLERLLKQISLYIEPEDQIIIQVDEPKASEGVRELLKAYKKKLGDNAVKIIWFKLDNDFGAFKNNLIKNAGGKGFLVLLDADEYPSNDFLINIKWVLSEYQNIDVIQVNLANYYLEPVDEVDINYYKERIEPRINQYGRFVDIDYKIRIMNLENKDIKYEGKVHEKLIGYKSIKKLPIHSDFKMEFIHFKSVGKQLNSDKLYNLLGE